MSLYDVIDEIGQRQCTKTETGDTRVYGVMVGLVAKNYDQNMPGRLCVTIPTRDGGANELQWARLALPFGGSKWGGYFMPEVGDQVLLVFEGGNLERPYVLGCVCKDRDSFLTGSADADNQIKRIVTKHGSTLLFEDGKEGEGEKDKITIQTAGKAHTVLLDNEGGKIRLSDKSGKNFMELKTEEGSGALSVQVESKLTVKVGDSITITANGATGLVKIEAKQVGVQAGEGFSVKSDGSVRLEGAMVTEKSSSSHKVESSGMMSIKGSVVKIG